MPPEEVFRDAIDVTADDPGKMGGGGGGGGSSLPGGYGGWGGGGGGGGGGAGGPTERDQSGGSLPIWDWMKKGAGAMGGPVGMGMDAFNMAAAPQQQVMEEAKAGSMAGHAKNQAVAWQSPEYQMWAQQIWGG